MTVEYSSSVSNCISAFRSEGITYAGLCLARRPINATAVTRFSNTSSFNAMNSDRTFSACARCLSKRSWSDERTVCLIVASTRKVLCQELKIISKEREKTWISYARSEKFIQDVADDLNGVATRLVTDRVLDE